MTTHSFSVAHPASHILTFAQTPAGGGVERAMLRLVRGWIAEGRRVTLVLGTPGGPADAEIPAGCDVIALGDARYATLLRAVPGVVRKVRPDVIFCPGNHYTSMAAWLRLRLGSATPPVIAKVSNALVRADMGGALAWGYRRWLASHWLFLDAMVAMTPGMRKEALAATGLHSSQTRVIANPPSVALVGAAAMPLPTGRFILGVGRLAPQKRWDRVIAALPRLADRTIPLVILGEGAERARLEALVAELGLQDRVFLPGHAADPLPAIARAALVVLASDFEGVPAVLREAAAAGTPVVASEASVAVREIVGEPEMGTIVPVGDMHALIAAIDDWLVPGRPRPMPRGSTGDPAGDYLTLFDDLVVARTVRARWGRFSPVGASSPVSAGRARPS